MTNRRYPRHPSIVTPTETTVGCGCVGLWLLLAMAFWGIVGYVAFHFITKFW